MNPPLAITLPSRRPLLSVWSVCSLLDCDSADVTKKIEDGTLPFAWDIHSSRSTKRHVRILARSVAEIQSNGKASAKASLSAVIDSILPHSRERFRACELARFFSCDLCHMTHLVREGSLCEIGKRKHTNQTRIVTRASVIKFLTARRML
ncbi:MAG: hypothetical protein ABI042_10565 [Verrucomicrobiota bacterium]